MLNAGYKKEAIAACERAAEKYHQTYEKTIQHITALHTHKETAVNLLKRTEDYINSIRNTPDELRSLWKTAPFESMRGKGCKWQGKSRLFWRNIADFSLSIWGFSPKGRKDPLSCLPQFSSGNGQGVEVCTGKHGIQSILVFLQTPISGLSISKLAFDNSKYVLHFTAHWGLHVFHYSIPINRTIRYFLQAAGAAVDPRTIYSTI